MKCRICKGSTVLAFTKENHNFMKCKMCETIQQEVIGTGVTDQYLSNKQIYDYYQATKPEDVWHADQVISFMDIRPGQTVLEIGIGCGTLGNVLQKKGVSYEGVEPNVYIAKKIKNLTLHTGFIEDLSLGKKYDHIIMSDVVEHLQDPVMVLRKVRENLAKDGKLMVSVPNFESVVTRLTQVKPDEHLFYFTPKGMQTLLRHSDYSLVSMEMTYRKRNIKHITSATTYRSAKAPVRALINFTMATGTYRLVNKVVSRTKDHITVIATHKSGRRVSGGA